MSFFAFVDIFASGFFFIIFASQVIFLSATFVLVSFCIPLDNKFLGVYNFHVCFDTFCFH